jgi:D-arabinose 1-dehydrogenase-like Zn-dependent alcohol dehydrogenase
MLLVSKELEIYGSRACGRDDVKQVIDLVTSSKINPFIGEIHPLVEANSVLDKLGRGDIVGRSVLIP